MIVYRTLRRGAPKRSHPSIWPRLPLRLVQFRRVRINHSASMTDQHTGTRNQRGIVTAARVMCQKAKETVREKKEPGLKRDFISCRRTQPLVSWRHYHQGRAVSLPQEASRPRSASRPLQHPQVMGHTVLKHMLLLPSTVAADAVCPSCSRH